MVAILLVTWLAERQPHVQKMAHFLICSVVADDSVQQYSKWAPAVLWCHQGSAYE